MKKKGTQQQNTSSAQDYRKEAKLHMAAIKNSWVIFAKTGVVVMAAAVVIFVATVAWFANNREVQANNMAIQMAGSPYELAVRGTKGKWDVEIPGVTDGNKIDIDGVTYQTTGAGGSIYWLVNEQSHVENNGKNPKGLEPGANGSITFYIYSRIDGELDIPLSLKLIGQPNENETLPEDAQNLLEGHILFFAGHSETDATYQGWISKDAQPWETTLSEQDGTKLKRLEDGTLQWSCGSAKMNTLYPVRLYWIWPEFFGQYVFKEQTHMVSQPVLFTKGAEETDTLNALPSALFSKMSQTPTGAVANSYLKWSRSSDTEAERELAKSIFQKIVTEQSLSNLRQSQTEEQLLDYGRMCNYYNRADQYIGEKIAYVKVQIEAQ